MSILIQKHKNVRTMNLTVFSTITHRASTQLEKFNEGYSSYSTVKRSHIVRRFEFLKDINWLKGERILCDYCSENIEKGQDFFIRKRRSFNKYYHIDCASIIKLI